MGGKRMSKPVIAAKAAVKAATKSVNGKTFKVRKTTNFTNAPLKKVNKTKFDSVKGYKVALKRDANTCLIKPVSTEKAIRVMEDCNTLTFMVQDTANKKLIAKAVESRFGVKVEKVNTLVTPAMKKKAYVRLSA